MELVIDFLFARGDDLVDFINIDARADDPLVRLEADGITEFRQRLRLARFRERPARIAAAFLLRVLVDFLDEREAGRILGVQAVRALSLAAEQDDVVAIHCVNPEIALPAIIAQIAHTVSRFFLGLFFRELARLLFLVVFFENAVGNLRFALHLPLDVLFKIRPIVHERILAVLVVPI